MTDFMLSFTSWAKKKRALLLLVLTTFVVFLILEWMHPYFFLQDDALKENLPFFVHNLRSILQGEFPLFNFHQYLGTPFFSLIQPASLYLPNYVALLLSKLVFGHYYGTMEFIAIFHLIICAAGFFKLMQYFGLDEWSSSFGAIAWTFCSFVITLGHTWTEVIGYAAYFPWMLLFSLRLMHEFKSYNLIMLVAIRVFALFLGYPPYFIYTITFDLLASSALYFILSAGGGDAKDGPAFCGFSIYFFRQAVSLISVFLLAAPLLLPALHQIRISAERSSPLIWIGYSQFGYELRYWLNGLFTPISGMKMSEWTPQPLQFVSHIGYLTIVFCASGLLMRHINRRFVVLFLFLAVFALLWADNTFVTKLIYHIPVYNQQRWPFKLVFFTSFFLITAATFGSDALFKRAGILRQYVAASVPVLFLLHCCNFVALYYSAPEGTLLFKAEKPPYEDNFREKMTDGRIVSIIPKSEHTLEKVTVRLDHKLLGFNFATLYGLTHFAGYHTLVAEKNLRASLDLNYTAYFDTDESVPLELSQKDLDYFRKWGVRWYVIGAPIHVAERDAIKPVLVDDRRTILYDAAARPMVYWADESGASGIEHLFSTNGVHINTERQDEGRLIVNVLYNDYFSAMTDGKQTNIVETGDGQMLIQVPAGKHSIEIVYSDPDFLKGIFVACSYLLIVLIGRVTYGLQGRQAGRQNT